MQRPLASLLGCLFLAAADCGLAQALPDHTISTAMGTMDSIISCMPAILIAAVSLVFAIRAHNAAQNARRRLEDTRKDQATLVARESIFRNIVENCGAGLWHVDADGHTLYVNSAMAKLFQVERVEDLAELHQDVLLINRGPLSDKAAKAFEATVSGRRGVQHKALIVETPVGGENGEPVTLLRTVTVVAQPEADQRKPRQAVISAIPLRPAAQL